MATKKRTTITFQPTDEVRDMVDWVVRYKGGSRSKVINDALREAFAKKGGRK